MADPLLLIGKNITVSGTKVGSLLDTTRALDFAARVSALALLPRHVSDIWNARVY